MIIRLIYNFVIDLVIFVCLAFWILFACTIIIPLFWNWVGGDYFYMKDFINEMRNNKL